MFDVGLVQAFADSPEATVSQPAPAPSPELLEFLGAWADDEKLLLDCLGAAREPVADDGNAVRDDSPGGKACAPDPR